MNFPSVSGKNWLFRKFDSTDVIKFSENHSLTEIVAETLCEFIPLVFPGRIHSLDTFLTLLSKS